MGGRAPSLTRETAAVELECSSMSDAPFGLIEFTGPDRLSFLHRLLSNDLMRPAGSATSAYYLNVQGRPLSRFWIFLEQDRCWLVCPRELTDVSLQELDKMHFGEKLRMQNRSADWQSTLLVGRGRRSWLQQHLPAECAPTEATWGLGVAPGLLWCRFPLLASGSELIFHQQSLPSDSLAPFTDFEPERIEACRAWPCDWGEKTMMLEVAEPEDYLDGKGCYPGQEVVARTLHRGHINRHIACLCGDGAAPEVGTRLSFQDKEVGWVSSSVATPEGFRALAYLRREVWEPATRLQSAGGGEMVVTSPRREA